MTRLRPIDHALAALALIALASSGRLSAQPMPEFTLPPASLVVEETFEQVTMARGSSQALLVVIGGRAPRLLRVALADGRVSDALAYDEPDGFSSVGPLWSWRADSLAFVDFQRGELLILAPDATLARRRTIGEPAENRRPRLPGLRVLVDTVAAIGPGAPTRRTSTTGRPLLLIHRYDFGRQRVDSVATYPGMAPPVPPRMREATGTLTVTLPLGLLEPNDTWGAFSDGTVALLRGASYAMQLVSPNGERRLLPSLAVQRVPFDEARRKRVLDVAERGVKEGMRRSGQGSRIANLVIEKPERLPDSLPHFSVVPSPVLDSRDRLWIAVFCATEDEATCYDVVDRNGERHVRLRLEPDMALLGFTPTHAIVAVAEKGKQRLQLHALP